ncbi:hypothetical protein [Microbacterium jejuense]|uniref:hypothetical protein n=1 Tax=Microbacterium jejuense TaxID=1263637 RepID=UPI0031EB8EC5
MTDQPDDAAHRESLRRRNEVPRGIFVLYLVGALLGTAIFGYRAVVSWWALYTEPGGEVYIPGRAGGYDGPAVLGVALATIGFIAMFSALVVLAGFILSGMREGTRVRFLPTTLGTAGATLALASIGALIWSVHPAPILLVCAPLAVLAFAGLAAALRRGRRRRTT